MKSIQELINNSVTYFGAVPNDTGYGIPITLYNAHNVTDVTFTLSYNPSLLAIAGAFGGSGSDATDQSAPYYSFVLNGTPTIIDATHATVDFVYYNSNAQSGNVVLGDIAATVPNSAANNYRAKQLLQLSSIVINAGAITGVVASNGVHVNAYFGDVSGNGTIDSADDSLIFNVAVGTDTGFGAYTLVDSAVVGDVAGDMAVDGGDVAYIRAYIAHANRPKIPTPPTGLTITITNEY
jgi:hypothetical protein